MTLFLVLGALAFWMDIYGASEWMAASKATVFGKHEYWRAWTTLLVHGDGKHLLSNALLFFVLGSFLTGYFGLWLVPLSALFLGGVLNFIVLSSMPEEVQLIGVSGVVFWMAGAWLLLYFLIETRRSLVQRSLRSLGVGLALFMPAEAFDPSISYKSHLWGFILGLLWATVYFAVKKRPLRQAEVRETTIEEAEGELETELVNTTNADLT